MAASRYLVVDIATAGIPDAAQYLEPVVAPSNYVKTEAIDAFVKKAEAAQVERAGLDPDLCQITGAGIMAESGVIGIKTRRDNDESDILEWLSDQCDGRILVSYNGLKFDWPIMMRRALYLDVPFKAINLDRYRSEHIDVFDKMTNHGVLPGKSLRFYANRFGWLDIDKPLSGAEEAKVFQTEDWDGLERSIVHDVTMCQRLGKRLGVL